MANTAISLPDQLTNLLLIINLVQNKAVQASKNKQVLAACAAFAMSCDHDTKGYGEQVPGLPIWSNGYLAR